VKVYVVEWDGKEIAGVFSSLEKAEVYTNKDTVSYRIDEFTLDIDSQLCMRCDHMEELPTFNRCICKKTREKHHTTDRCNTIHYRRTT